MLLTDIIYPAAFGLAVSCYALIQRKDSAVWIIFNVDYAWLTKRTIAQKDTYHRSIWTIHLVDRGL